MSANQLPPRIMDHEEVLGTLAMKFRGTRDSAARRAIAEEYAKTVTKLISSDQWVEMPAPEDQLPDEFMPEAFFDFWAH